MMTCAREGVGGNMQLPACDPYIVAGWRRLESGLQSHMTRHSPADQLTRRSVLMQGIRYNVCGVRLRRQSSYYYRLVIIALLLYVRCVCVLLYVSDIPLSSSSGVQLHLETCTNNAFIFVDRSDSHASG